MKEYDYLIVGAGLYGSVVAHELTKLGYLVLVIDKKEHVGGNIYSEKKEGIEVHMYGAHIFHTSEKPIWDYINSFGEFNDFINTPLAIYENETYNLPFNMNTFSKLYGVKTPSEAKEAIAKDIEGVYTPNPKNFEEQALNLVGKRLYEKLIKGYTEKQWGRKAKDLPSFIIKRVPLRFTYNNNYFDDIYQGIPINGYTEIIKNLLKGIEVRLHTDFMLNKKEFLKQAKKVIFTGRIDEYYDFILGHLDYRSLEFKHEVLDVSDFQGNAVINYTSSKVPYTRVIEHKYFNNTISSKTVITYEYPKKFVEGLEPFYPINDEENNSLYQKYQELARTDAKVIFGGRLGEFKYYDMDDTIKSALELIELLKSE